MSQISARDRVAFLDAALRKASDDAARWGWFWRAAFQTSAVVGWSIAPFMDKKADKYDAYASGFKSTVGFAFATIFMLPAERHRDRGEPTVSCASVAELEATLVRDADGEAKGRSVGMHILGGVFNVGVGVGVGFVTKRWSTALGGIAIGGAVGSVRIFTQPTTASDALVVYRSGELVPQQKPVVSGSIEPIPGGVAFSASWTF
ncbi:MAG: hypothetical protein ACXVEF_11005 [Polyangiales bacterium]